MTKIIFDPRDQTILVCEQDKEEIKFLGVPKKMEEGNYKQPRIIKSGY